jgi:hypothetical protein
MGGQSKSTQTQNSTTEPWKEAQPALQGILSQLTGNLGKTGITGAETGALDTLTANGNNFTQQYGQPIADYAKNLLSGGGATDQSGAVNQNFQDYQRRLAPTADGSNIGANSGLRPYLDTIRDDVTSQVNGSFAAAGRDFSGANFGALGRGISAGMAPVIAAQYNTDTANQRGASDALYGAGNTNAGILSGLNQQKLSNQGQGVAAAGAANDAQNAGANATLQAEAARRGIPVQALGLLAQIGIPIAGLGGQSTGTSTGTQTDSGMKQFMQFTQGISNLMPKAPISFGG